MNELEEDDMIDDDLEDEDMFKQLNKYMGGN